MPVNPPELCKAERVTQPLNCFLDIGVNQFRYDTRRPGRATDQHSAPFVDLDHAGWVLSALRSIAHGVLANTAQRIAELPGPMGKMPASSSQASSWSGGGQRPGAARSSDLDFV